MKRAALWLGLGLLCAVVLGLVLSGGEPTGFPSARSRGPAGLLAARLYLEAELEKRGGGEVALLDRPPGEGFEAEVMVTMFPWRRVWLDEEFNAINLWVRRGGLLVIGYSGRAKPAEEERFFSTFGIELEDARQSPPLSPLAWRQYQRERWTLLPREGAADLPPLEVRAMPRVPRPPAGAEVLFARESAVQNPPPGSVFRLRRGEGTVLVLPADLLGHGGLREPGAAALWASLINSSSRAGSAASPRWLFDEYHQGLLAADLASAEVSLLPFDLFLAHVVVVYLLGLWAVAKRFGPAWRERPPRLGTSGSFLVGLGRQHDRLGHHREAAQLLVARAAELDPSLASNPRVLKALEARAATAGRAELVAIGREIAAQRRAGKPQENSLFR